ncbi:ABC transporter substrate-binding, putative [Babesia ovis]|uniref:ABC transporter substrate-binding, putative n=1 Tax=Babesia ovis TaxID=5869 RepID=A0A9W5WTW7_BABOV|nr:ABC transporter substrate-binding, putative [Babesia ovis]
MKSRKRDGKINGRGIQRGSEAAIIKPENFYFREFDDAASTIGLRRIEHLSELLPPFRPNIFVQPQVIRRLNTFGISASTHFQTPVLCPFLPEDAIIPEDVLKSHAASPESLWQLDPFALPSYSPLQALSRIDVADKETHTPSNRSSKRTPVRHCGDSSVNSTTSGKRSMPETFKRDLCGQLKGILKNAIKSSTLLYISGDDLHLGDQTLEVEGKDATCTSLNAHHQDASCDPTSENASIETGTVASIVENADRGGVCANDALFDAMSLISPSSINELSEGISEISESSLIGDVNTMPGMNIVITMEGLHSCTKLPEATGEPPMSDTNNTTICEPVVLSTGIKVDLQEPTVNSGILPPFAASTGVAPTRAYPSLHRQNKVTKTTSTDSAKSSTTDERCLTSFASNTTGSSDMTDYTSEFDVCTDECNPQAIIQGFDMKPGDITNETTGFKDAKTIDGVDDDDSLKDLEPLDQKPLDEFRREGLCQEFIFNYNEKRENKRCRGLYNSMNNSVGRTARRGSNIMYGYQRKLSQDGLPSHSGGADRVNFGMKDIGHRHWGYSGHIDMRRMLSFDDSFGRNSTSGQYGSTNRDDTSWYKIRDSKTSSRNGSNESLDEFIQSSKNYRDRSFDRMGHIESRSIGHWRQHRSSAYTNDREMRFVPWRNDELQRYPPRGYNGDHDTYHSFRDSERHPAGWRGHGTYISEIRPHDEGRHSHRKQYQVVSDDHRRYVGR